MWAALPLTNVKLDTNSTDWLTGEQWRFAHQFLYRDNDADRLLNRARFMIALLGVLLGVLLFFWSLELFGYWPAVIVLGLFCTEPNLVAHAGLVTTDLGATCFIFGAAYFAWRVNRRFSAGNVAGLAIFFSLAVASKYSAVLFIPFLFVRPRVLPVLLSAYLALWAVYGFRHEPGGPGKFEINAEMQRRLPHLAPVMKWIDDRHLLPNAAAEGFLLMTAKSQQRPAYLLGEISDRGWWYYFPLAFLIKTPVALLLLSLVGLALCLRDWRTAIFAIGPPLIYFAVAMVGHLNIGVRHILVVYPFAILLAGWTISTFAHRRLILAGVCAFQLFEFVAIYPHCLAFFNTSVGGARHGAEYLVDSNLDWGQDLKLLKKWMIEHQVPHINLSYFGAADPAYYGIRYTPLPGSPIFDRDHVAKPTLPGYVAVSATNLRMRDVFAPLRNRPPVAVLGYSIHIYWIEQPWWL